MAAHDLAAEALHGRQHRQQRAAGRQDVVHEQHALARRDPEPAPELAPDRAVLAAHLLGEDRARAELAPRLEREDDAAGRRPGDQVHQATAGVLRDPHRDELTGRDRILEHLELLHVAVRVAATLELEMALAQRADAPEQLLGAGSDRPGARRCRPRIGSWSSA